MSNIVNLEGYKQRKKTEGHKQRKKTEENIAALVEICAKAKQDMLKDPMPFIREATDEVKRLRDILDKISEASSLRVKAGWVSDEFAGRCCPPDRGEEAISKLEKVQAIIDKEYLRGY